MNIIDSSLSIIYPSEVVEGTKKTLRFELSFDYDDGTCTPSIEDHNKLLSQSLRVAKYWSYLCIPFALIGSMRWYIWILYAQNLGEKNSTTLGFVVYACYFIQGIGSMFWATIGDKYRYDKVATILVIINVCAVAIESIAPDFNVLIVGTMLLASTRGVGALSLAFVAKYLPNEYAVQYTSYLYALAASAYLIGPVISGLIIHFFGYRAVYTACAVILALCLLYILCLISGSQKPLEMKQRRMKELYIALANDTPSANKELLSENSQFPVCIERFGLMEQTVSKPIAKQEPAQVNIFSVQNSLNLTESLVDNDGFSLNGTGNTGIAIKKKQNVSYYYWFLMINTLIANACLLGIEGVTSTYYLVYCNEEFEESIIDSTIQIALFVLLFISACVATPPLLKCCSGIGSTTSSEENNKKSYNWEYGVLFVGHIVNIPLYLVVWQRAQSIKYMRWMIMCAAGIGLGVTNMTQEVMLLEFQPKQHAGKVSGAKIMARQFMKAFACLAVGVLWTKQVYWFLWVMGYLYAISLLLTVIMFVVQKYKSFLVN